MVKNVTWKDRVRNEELYGPLMKLSNKIRARILQHAGHFHHHRKEEVAGAVLLWIPDRGRRDVGRPKFNYLDMLRNDTGCATADLPTLMDDRRIWRKIVCTRRNQLN